MDLSIVIISFNTKELTTECLKSIFRNTKDISYEVIVVDNSSADGSVDSIRNFQFPAAVQAHYSEKSRGISKYQLKMIENKENVGFAKANNQGANLAKGKYILFLNSDTVVRDNVLGRMVKWMDKRDDVGVATCALINKDGTIQGSGGYFPTLFKVFSWMFFIEDLPFLDRVIKPFHPVHSSSFFYKGLGQFKKARNQDWVTGAFLLTKADVFKKVGGFDEDYFMYTEEVDLCFRIKKLGKNIWYLPEWQIIHLGGASSHKEFPILSEFKSIKLFYKKNMPDWQYFWLRLFMKAGTIFRSIIFGLINGKEAYRLYARAFREI